MRRFLTALGSAVVLSACYHATIETGLTPSTETIYKPWASGWVYGLVPPATVSTASQCKSGVARVETVHSFLNQLVGFLTLGIYTPMEIKVTCAAGKAALNSDGDRVFGLRNDASDGSFQSVFTDAATAAVSNNEPVYVVFSDGSQAD